jgi:hypothetical protein
MAFVSIPNSIIQIGKAIKKELWDILKGSLDDHESRLSVLEAGASQVVIFDETIYNSTRAATLTGMLFFKASRDITVTSVQIQIFETGVITTGLLKVDLKKASSLDPAFFSSILTTEAEIDFTTANDFETDNATINPVLNAVPIDSYLRVDVTSLPATPLGKFRVRIFGELD